LLAALAVFIRPAVACFSVVRLPPTFPVFATGKIKIPNQFGLVAAEAIDKYLVGTGETMVLHLTLKSSERSVGELDCPGQEELAGRFLVVTTSAYLVAFDFRFLEQFYASVQARVNQAGDFLVAKRKRETGMQVVRMSDSLAPCQAR
jgi:hypothetical protein